MDENRPGYYAVIPADVRYDDQIPANAKLLYGEISALIGADGFCYASNSYFMKIYPKRRNRSKASGFRWRSAAWIRAEEPGRQRHKRNHLYSG